MMQGMAPFGGMPHPQMLPALPPPWIATPDPNTGMLRVSRRLGRLSRGLRALS